MSEVNKRPGMNGLNTFANALREMLGFEKLYHENGKERTTSHRPEGPSFQIHPDFSTGMTHKRKQSF